MKKIFWIIPLIILAAIVVMIVRIPSSRVLQELPAQRESLSVFVSIPPQVYFVKRVTGYLVDITLMVPPGSQPHDYAPTPKQIARLSTADAYFRIGVSFEDALIQRIQSINPTIELVDTRCGITLAPMQSHAHHDNDDQGRLDPHTWLNPILVSQQADTICQTVCQLDPQNTLTYKENLASFQADLAETDKRISKLLGTLSQRKFMVFHPAFGYFAKQYNLVQVPVELAGKQPSAQQLTKIIQHAKQENIKVVFVQPQFDSKNANAIAVAIGGRVVEIDALAEDYLDNLERIAQALHGVLK